MRFLKPLSLVAFLVPLAGGHVSHDQGQIWGTLESVVLGTLGNGSLPILSLFLLSAGLATHAFFVKSIRVQRTVLYLSLFFIAWLALTLLWSRYRFDSLLSILTFATFTFALIAGSDVDDPQPVLASLFAGTVVFALLGAHEYITHVGKDPNWRVFALAYNPNIAAGVLGVGLFSGLAILRRASGYGQLLTFLGMVPMLLVLLLTQSRGGALALLVATIAFAIFRFRLGPKARGSFWAFPAVAICALAAFPVMMAKLSGSSRTQSMVSQAPAANTEAGISTAYRLHLYKGVMRSVKERPFGTGAGTYRIEGARTVDVQPARQAHGTLFELASDSGIVGPLAFIALVSFSLIHGLRNATLRVQEGLEVPAIAGGLVFLFVQALFESSLYYPALGLAFFLFLGLVGRSSENPSRTAVVLPVVSSLVACALLYFGIGEGYKAFARRQIAIGNTGVAQGAVNSLHRFAPWDDEVWMLSADLEAELRNKIDRIERAAQLKPWYGNWGYLAGFRLNARDMPGARIAADRSLEGCPNDPDALLMALHTALDDPEVGTPYLRALIDLENSPFTQVQPVANVVFTHAAEARRLTLHWLADEEERAKQKVRAASVFVRYVDITLPHVLHLVRSGQKGGFAGETLKKGLEKIVRAQQLCRDLASSPFVDRSFWKSEGVRMAAAEKEFKVGLIFRGKPVESNLEDLLNTPPVP